MAEAREDAGFRPCLFEVSFGRGDPPLEFDTGERTVAFHGRIDRVDKGPRGRFRVIDYKTGRLRGKDDDLGAGTSLQLPVYLLAASSLLSAPPVSGEARYLSVSHLDRRRKVTIHGEAWEALCGEFAGVIDVIVGGIESGLFFPFPSGPACRNCDVAVACPTSRDRVYESKVSNDARCAGFAALRGKGAG